MDAADAADTRTDAANAAADAVGIQSLDAADAADTRADAANAAADAVGI